MPRLMTPTLPNCLIFGQMEGNTLWCDLHVDTMLVGLDGNQDASHRLMGPPFSLPQDYKKRSTPSLVDAHLHLLFFPFHL